MDAARARTRFDRRCISEIEGYGVNVFVRWETFVEGDVLKGAFKQRNKRVREMNEADSAGDVPQLIEGTLKSLKELHSESMKNPANL